VTELVVEEPLNQNSISTNSISLISATIFKDAFHVTGAEDGIEPSTVF